MNQYAQREMEQIQPRGYAEYMSNYGEHFSKAMCQWAVSMMRNRNGEKLDFLDKKGVDEMLAKNGVTLQHDKGYDAVYAMHMAIADFMGSSIEDEAHLAKYVKDLLDDPDGYDGQVFNRFVMDCLGRGVPIVWEDMI